jgi:hypothetical protein
MVRDIRIVSQQQSPEMRGRNNALTPFILSNNSLLRGRLPQEVEQR